jgi:hypothetical protein
MLSVTRRAPSSVFPGRIRTATRADGCTWGCSQTPFGLVAMSSMTLPVRRRRLRVAANCHQGKRATLGVFANNLARPVRAALGDEMGSVSRHFCLESRVSTRANTDRRGVSEQPSTRRCPAHVRAWFVRSASDLPSTRHWGDRRHSAHKLESQQATGVEVSLDLGATPV